MNPKEVFEGDDEYTWREAFHVTDLFDWTEGDPEHTGKAESFDQADVVEVFAAVIEPGDYAEENVYLFGKLADGRFFYLTAGCDTTGWDCQAGGRVYVAMTRELLERFAITIEERTILGLEVQP